MPSDPNGGGRLVRHAVLVSLILGLLGVSVVSLFARSAPTQTEIVGSPTTNMAESMGDEEVRTFAATVGSALQKGDFPWLEDTYSGLRSGVDVFTGGLPKLAVFYRSLGSYRYGGYAWWPASGVAEDQFELDRGMFSKWLTAYPHSVAAQIGLAKLWENRATTARGDGIVIADRQQWKAALTEEGNILAVVPRTDPEVFDTILRLLKVTGYPDTARREIFDAGVRAYPAYYPLYMDRARSLEPRWGGAQGALADFARSLLESPDAGFGIVAYSLIVSAEAEYYDLKDLYPETGLTWADTSLAFEARKARYGFTNDDWNLLLYAASASPDKRASKESLDHIALWSRDIFETKRRFDQVTAWVVTGTP